MKNLAGENTTYFRKGYRMGFKIISLILVNAFLLQQIIFAAPGVIKPISFNVLQKPHVSFKLPKSVASLEDTYKARHPERSEGSQKTIILIQDAHTNDSGQINVSKTLDLILQKEQGIKSVYLEAGQGNESLSFVRDLVSLNKRKRIGMSFLRKGMLQGSEYMDLTTRHDITLWGVEDMSLYKKAWDSYKTINQKKDKFQHYLKKIRSTINTLKPKIYNPQLLSFDNDYQSYLKEQISLTLYFDILQKQAKRQRIPLF